MKRYDTYKNSGIEWIGEIPEHWSMKKLKNELDFNTGFTPPSGNSDYYNNGENIWITIRDMKGKYLDNSKTKITDLVIEKYKPKILPKNSLLFSFKLSIGKVAFNLKDLYTNEAIFSISPNEEVNLKFFYYSLPLQVVENANENIYGAKILNQELIRNSNLLLPPKQEQTKIANYLDQKTTEIDQLISQKESLLKLYEEEKTAIINQAVTKGINPKVKLKDSGVDWLGEIPVHWEVKKLKYVVSKIGSGVTPRGGASVYQLSGIPFLRSQNIHFDRIILDNVAYISESINNKMEGSKVFQNDVLLNITGASIGRCYFVTNEFEEANVNQHVCIIRPKKLIFTKFLYYILRSNIGQEQIRQEQTGSGREGLNFEVLKQFYLPFLRKEEQTQIVNHIETETTKINTKVTNTNKLIALLKEYKTALISEVVTGKIKVN